MFSKKVFLSDIVTVSTAMIPTKKYFKKNYAPILLLVAMVINTSASAQGVDKVYSVFLFNFARSVQWPADKMIGDFTIGVLNSPKVAEELRIVAATKNVGAQKIKVKEYASIEQIESCHILFLPSLKANAFPSVIKKIPDAPTLLVTDTEGLASKVGGINFITIDNKMRFELNVDAIEKRGLKIPSSLKTLGIPVQ
jgi:hypothetical protein